MRFAYLLVTILTSIIVVRRSVRTPCFERARRGLTRKRATFIHCAAMTPFRFACLCYDLSSICCQYPLHCRHLPHLGIPVSPYRPFIVNSGTRDTATYYAVGTDMKRERLRSVATCGFRLLQWLRVAAG